MTHGRNHAFENIQNYLGKVTGILAALILVISYLFWYSIQIKVTTETLLPFFKNSPGWIIGCALGSIVAILSGGGIRVIKYICVITFPLLICLTIYLLFNTKNEIQFKGTWGFSFTGMVATVLIWLPGMVNLPI